MNIMTAIKKLFFSKTFRIELDEENTYPNEKDFIFPDVLVMCAAIENYGIKLRQTISFISKDKPIVFILNNKEKYQADLVLGYGKFNQGYYIFCRKID